MKLSLVIFTILSLQFAVAQLCLCSGMHPGRDADTGAERPSCCEAADPLCGESSRESCPHCDETDAMDLDLPLKGISAPEWAALELLDPAPLCGSPVPPAVVSGELSRSGLPPGVPGTRRSVSALFGVFLI